MAGCSSRSQTALKVVREGLQQVGEAARDMDWDQGKEGVPRPAAPCWIGTSRSGDDLRAPTPAVLRPFSRLGLVGGRG